MSKLRKITKGHIISILALLMVALMVPVSTAAVDGMNMIVGGGEKQLGDFNKASSYENRLVPSIGTLNPVYAAEVVVYWRPMSQGLQYAPQLLLTGDITGDDYNQFIIATSSEIANECGIYFMTAITPDSVVESGLDHITMNVSLSRTVQMSFGSMPYRELTAGLFGFTSSVMFYGITSTGNVIGVDVPFTMNRNSVLNFTAGQWTEWTFELDKVAVLQAQNYLKDCSVVSMAIFLRWSGTTTFLEKNDHVSFTIDAYAKPVNGFAVADLFTGILGVGLIVGAVFATPWIGRRARSGVKQAGKKAGGKIKSGGKKAIQTSRSKVSSYKSRRGRR